MLLFPDYVTISGDYSSGTYHWCDLTIAVIPAWYQSRVPAVTMTTHGPWWTPFSFLSFSNACKHLATGALETREKFRRSLASLASAGAPTTRARRRSLVVCIHHVQIFTVTIRRFKFQNRKFSTRIRYFQRCPLFRFLYRRTTSLFDENTLQNATFRRCSFPVSLLFIRTKQLPIWNTQNVIVRLTLIQSKRSITGEWNFTKTTTSRGWLCT